MYIIFTHIIYIHIDILNSIPIIQLHTTHTLSILYIGLLLQSKNKITYKSTTTLSTQHLLKKNVMLQGSRDRLQDQGKQCFRIKKQSHTQTICIPAVLPKHWLKVDTMRGLIFGSLHKKLIGNLPTMNQGFGNPHYIPSNYICDADQKYFDREDHEDQDQEDHETRDYQYHENRTRRKRTSRK